MSGDGPGTDIELTDKLMNTLPTDNVPNRMMFEGITIRLLSLRY